MRPIDADALLQKIEEWDSQLRSFTHYTDRIALDVLCGVVDKIEDLDTLDYAPVRRGEWIEKIEPYAYTATGREIHIFHCSACDFTWANKRMVFDHFKHCPNCGAKMDGGKSGD